jgi:hypothetical protein
MPASFYSSSIVTLSWITGSASGPSVKRAVVLSLINSICKCVPPPGLLQPSWNSSLFLTLTPFSLTFIKHPEHLDELPVSVKEEIRVAAHRAVLTIDIF